MQDKIKIIREACIKANPEIVELKWGCHIQDFGGSDLIIVGQVGVCPKTHKKHNEDCLFEDGVLCFNTDMDNPDTCEIPTEVIKPYMIYGRDIRLADVLLAIHAQNPANKTNITVECDGQFIQKSYNPEQWNGKNRWNLKSDSLEAQSEETIEFIYSLLK